MPDKTLKELADSRPDAAMAVGELEHVVMMLEGICKGEDVRRALEEYIDIVRARIEGLDESGEARAWAEAWRRAEEAEHKAKVEEAERKASQAGPKLVKW